MPESEKPKKPRLGRPLKNVDPQTQINFTTTKKIKAALDAYVSSRGMTTRFLMEKLILEFLKREQGK
jgi:hypothetical protein